MYCVIQKIVNKKPNLHGESKKLEVNCTTLTIDGKSYIKYYYAYSQDKFERPMRVAYKISIHKSYRENGKPKKKQWVICTMGYYDIADSLTWFKDYMRFDELDRKLEEMGMTEDELCNMVYEKLDPIIETIKKEFESTEEYRAKKAHRVIIDAYLKAKEIFEKKYGDKTYDYCYDVFGALRNEKYLKELQANYEVQQHYKSSYYDNFRSNYNNNDFSSYYNKKQSTYTESEKQGLKKIFKVLAMNFHPDRYKEDDGEIMKLVNKLKEEWKI